MVVGDRVRLKSKTCGQDILGLPQGEIGVVKDIDATRLRTSVLISFPEANVYTSALRDDDVEVLESDARRSERLL